MRKKVVQTISLIFSSTIIFCLLTIFTCKIRSHVDGPDKYGFPFIFYKYIPDPRNTYFYTLYFIIDIFVAIFISLIINAIYKLCLQNKKN